MADIQKYSCEELAGVEISCLMVKGDPWFCGKEVATVLAYKYPSDAVKDHVPLKFKSKLSYLIKASKIGKTPTLDVSELNTYWISEPGLYKLILKSQLKTAEIFQDWVCSEVLPSIRKTGGYNNKYYYNKSVATKDDVKKLASNCNRTEDVLHHQVKQHINDTYPDAIIHAGLGEHLTTKHAGLDAQLKGYSAGEPDITIMRKLPNGFHDILAIELKAPTKECKADDHQAEYHKVLKNNANIDTIVGNKYEKIIIDIHDHYKEVFARARTPAIADKQPEYNFSTNNNPKYWCNKLQNKTNLLIECKKRGYEDTTYQVMTNCEIAKVLIDHDSGKDRLVIEM